MTDSTWWRLAGNTISCGVCWGCGGGGGEGSEAADGVGGPLSPPPETACAGNLAVVAMDTLPWLRLPAAETRVETGMSMADPYGPLACRTYNLYSRTFLRYREYNNHFCSHIRCIYIEIPTYMATIMCLMITDTWVINIQWRKPLNKF